MFWRKNNKSSPCYSPAEGEIVHAGFKDTGKRKSSRSPDYEIWVLRCLCGRKKLQRQVKKS